MRTKWKCTPRGLTLGAWSLGVVLLCGSAMDASAATISPCKTIAKLTLYSELHDASADFWLEAAKANNLPTSAERNEALSDAKKDLWDNVDEIEDKYDARLYVCNALGGGRYNPNIDPDDFLTPAETAASPNPYLPLIPGQTRVYRKITDEGTEIVTVRVTHDTREILGVTCIVVHDTAEFDGEVEEDTLDWYAQDSSGNVWYFGEQSLEYANDKVVSIDGSWEAGEDGALPGIIMKASPMIGNVYRQEFAPGEAEDLAQVLSLAASETVPYGAFNNCLKTADFTPMEPDHLELKYFAPGVGEILAVSTATGAREELISLVTE